MNRTEKNHAKAIQDLEHVEKRMARIFKKWLELRAKVKRYDARADKLIGGEYDVRDLMEPAKEPVRSSYRPLVRRKT